MKSVAQFNRPSLEAAVKDWKKLLAERGFATDLVWIFAENLCVEKSRTEPGGFHFGFQTRFTPPSEDALDIAFEHFCETGRADRLLPAGRASGQIRLHAAVRSVV